MVAKGRFLESPADGVRLGFSSTHVYSYGVWVHRVHLLVSRTDSATQSWQWPLAECQWLQADSLYVAVTLPLFREAHAGAV